MSYQVALAGRGYAGWRMMVRTQDSQRAMVARDPTVQRSHAYFREKMPKTTSAADLVADYRLLKIVLESAGLENDINNRFFIRKVLESDLTDDNSLANRLSDKRYLQLARSFEFGKAADHPDTAARIDDVLARHVSAEFENRVGQADADMRLALFAQRELTALASTDSTEKTKWFKIIGSAPLRKVVEGALGFGSAYSKLPIDRQVSELQNATQKLLGGSDPALMAEPKNMEKVVQRFMLRAQAQSGMQSGYAVALALLRR